MHTLHSPRDRIDITGDRKNMKKPSTQPLLPPTLASSIEYTEYRGSIHRWPIMPASSTHGRSPVRSPSERRSRLRSRSPRRTPQKELRGRSFTPSQASSASSRGWNRSPSASRSRSVRRYRSRSFSRTPSPAARSSKVG